jgi:ABC-type multidrug transport system ATPase subunit
MNEPTAGVDIEFKQIIWKDISSLKDKTTIITSHVLEEAEPVSSRLFIVDGGKLIFQRISTELRRQYQCGYFMRIHNPNDTLIL